MAPNACALVALLVALSGATVDAWHWWAPMSWCPTYWVGDGICDDHGTIPCNTAEYDFDGGDCCIETNKYAQWYGPNGYWWMARYYPLNCKSNTWETTSDWSDCSAECGGGTRTRTVVCKVAGAVAADSECDASKKPATSEACNTAACQAGWMQPCPSSCTTSMKSNDVCDGQCNNPYCEWDNGACCPETAAANIVVSDEFPQHCFDPLHSEKHGNYRFEYNEGKGACRTEVKNQGSCGSCYAFSVTTAAEYQMCKAGAGSHNLSPQHMVSCSETLEWSPGRTYPRYLGNPTDGCRGGFTSQCMSHFALKGFRTEACYPYLHSGDGAAHMSAATQGPISCEDAYAVRQDVGEQCTDENNKFYVEALQGEDMLGTVGNSFVYYPNNGDYWSPKLPLNPINADRIREILHQVGPVSMSYKIYNKFFYHHYHKGPHFAYPPSVDFDQGPVAGGHAVVLTGYGEWTNAAGERRRYWVVENSWGKNWGDNGYFYMNAEDPVWGLSGVPYAQIQWTTSGGRTDMTRTSADYIVKTNTYGDTPTQNTNNPFQRRRSTLGVDGPGDGMAPLFPDKRAHPFGPLRRLLQEVDAESEAVKVETLDNANQVITANNQLQEEINSVDDPARANEALLSEYGNNLPVDKDCQRDQDVKDVLETQAIPYIQDLSSTQGLPRVTIDINEINTCQVQVAAGLNFFFSVRVMIDGVLDKMFDITVTERLCETATENCDTILDKYGISFRTYDPPADAPTPSNPTNTPNGPNTPTGGTNSGSGTGGGGDQTTNVNVNVHVPAAASTPASPSGGDGEEAGDDSDGGDHDYVKLFGAVFGGIVLAGGCLLCCGMVLKLAMQQLVPAPAPAAAAAPATTTHSNPTFGDNGVKDPSRA